MELNVKHDLAKLEKNLNSLGQKAFKPAANAAINKIGQKNVSTSLKEVSKVQRVQQKLVRKRITIKRSNFKTLTYQASVNARGISWHSLGAKVIRRGSAKKTLGIKAGTGSNKHIHRHAFIGKSKTGGNEQVFVRKTDERYPLRVLRVRLYTPFNRAFKARVKTAKTEFLTELNRQLQWRVEKELNKNA